MNKPAKPIERHHDTGRSKPITILGVTYPSVTNAALSNGISPGTLANRLRRNVPEDKLLKQGYGGRRSVQKREFYTREKNWAQIARDRGVNYGTLMQRIRAGVPEGELFKDPSATTKAGLPVAVGSKTYASVSEASRALGISTTTLRKRMREGLEGEDLTKPARRGKKGISVRVCGVEYRNLAHVAEQHGLSRALVSLRYKNGKRDEELIANPREGSFRGKEIVIQGETYASITEASRLLDVPYQDLRVLTTISCQETLDRAVSSLIETNREAEAA